MKAIKSIIRNGNDVVCGEGSLLNRLCGPSTTGAGKSYLIAAGISLFVQYLLPIAIVMLIIPIVIGNVVALGVIGLLATLNPIALLGIIVVGVVDAGIAIVALIAGIVGIVVYCWYFFKNIGALAVIPVVAWMASIILGMIPYVGGIISAIINLFPWMAFAVAVHWWSYSDKRILNVDLKELF